MEEEKELETTQLQSLYMCMLILDFSLQLKTNISVYQLDSRKIVHSKFESS